MRNIYIILEEEDTIEKPKDWYEYVKGVSIQQLLQSFYNSNRLYLHLQNEKQKIHLKK
jgi:hypothetical protein